MSHCFSVFSRLRVPCCVVLSSGPPSLCMPVHTDRVGRGDREVLRAEEQVLILNGTKHSRVGPLKYLRNEFLEKSIAKSQAMEEQNLGRVQDERSWICMPLMYRDDA